ncbi:glycosyltransferase [Microbacterium azadirachtae]
MPRDPRNDPGHIIGSMSGLIAHEWVEGSGGAEVVLDAMLAAFPDADVRCLWDDAPQRFPGRSVKESWLAHTPLRHHKALAAPFSALAWRGMKADQDYEWVLASSHLFAHHASVRHARVPKYVYAHTPARYLWASELDRRGQEPLVRAVAPAFKALDRRRAQEATAIAANSQYIRERIARSWDRDAVVIHPPVATEQIAAVVDWEDHVADPDERRMLDALPEVFLLGASRFVPYKRLDTVIAAAEAAGLPVVVAGHGPDAERLTALAAAAGVPARVVLNPSTPALYALLQRSAAFVFPPIEDFGILPVEAQAAGTPVVVGPVGGQTETLTPGVSGVIAATSDASGFARAISTALELAPFEARAVTERFGAQVFERRIREFVGQGDVGSPAHHLR